MPTIYALVVGWILLVAVFIWMHVPERTIADVIRGVESQR
jgi:hypothetical protein